MTQPAADNRALLPPDDDMPDFDSAPTAKSLPPLDRSRAENYATCPLMAWLIDQGRVINSSFETASGQEAHECLSQTTQEYLSAAAGGTYLGKSELADMLRSYMAHSRPDVQPDVINALRASAWSWCEFITDINPQNILRFDGGSSLGKSGQIGWAVDRLGVTLTTELDFLYAGASKQQLHIVDYKSGHKSWTAADVKEAFQFQLQGLLTLKNYEAIESVEIRVWNTRLNRLTYGVEVARDRLPDIERRMIQAATLAVQYGKAADAEQVPAWPTVSKCEQCRAAIYCHATPPSEVDNDPQAFLLAMHAQQVALDAMHNQAAAYVAIHGEIKYGGLAFGIKPPTRVSNKPQLYLTGANDAADHD